MEIHLLLFLCLGFLFHQKLVLGADNVTVHCTDGEEYLMCGACERTCENPLSKEPCTTPCTPGCFCKAGLVRNRQERCVSPKECNINKTSCGENEEYLDCGSSCPLTCTNFHSVFCTKQCTKGCFCKPGYVLGPNKTCILPRNCPIGPCQENEAATDCVNPCNSCAERGKCTFEYCGRGCDCKHGFHRNSSGHCVDAKDCDVPESACPKHEHLVSCVSQCNDCWSRGECEQGFCQSGCDCHPGFFRNDNGDCIPESQCIAEETSCGVNEEYADCVNPCNDCIKQGQCQYNCEYGCDCKKGFFRDTKGVCIPAEQCEATLDSRNCRSCRNKCPVNQQYYICMPTCKTTCENFNDTTVPCGIDCRSGCFCKQGLVMRNDGVCILPSECPQKCGINEEYNTCGSACPESCKNYGKSIMCTHQCVKGCFCKTGFIRGPQGTCIQPHLCPAGCGENEEYLQCGSACPRTCQNHVRTVACHHECVRGCFCRPGFVRGPKGNCINPAFCPVVCGLNEEFQKCGSGCPLSCANITASQSLPCHSQCVPGCFCKRGFIRGPDGSCIPRTSCPPVCRENEEFQECGTPCPATCHNHTNPRPCPNMCVRGCTCKPGYVKGPDGRCILPQQCPVVCKEKEEYMECGPPCPSTCGDIGQSLCASPCTKGCFCRRGLVRGPEGKCIPPALCPVVCGPNQEFFECGPACPLSCTNYTLPNTHANVNECHRGCFCKLGFVIGPDGSCILPTACPKVCGENEEFKECGTACPVTCDNRLTLQQCNKRCVKGCFCSPGFIRGPYGKCILPQQCPQVCGENEEFKECGTACPLTCSNRTRLGFCEKKCVRGCFCRNNFVRDPSGRCVMPQMCPVVCGENEEFKECGTACPLTCLNRTRQGFCEQKCVRGCFCRNNFVRDPSGKCVMPQMCPVVCGENEEFKECGTACPLTCTNRAHQRFCPNNCIRGCFCREGFVNDPSGRCILPQQCPAVCRENEEFQQCGPACPITCDTISRPTAPCPLPCTNGCFCKPGFVRGPDGRCISPTSCPVVCGENEEFKQCGTACPLTCANRTQQGFCPNVCVKGCFCRPGFVRDSSGKCVLPQTCPVVCSQNEEFKECGPACPITCDTLTHANVPCTLPCTRGCFCKPGFVRGPDGKCVLPAFCPVVCGENEEFKECGLPCPLTCSNITQQRPCLLPCAKGCFCRAGFVRDPTGKCISPRSCPVVCKPNEEFQECGPACQVTCDNLGVPAGPCSLKCERGCFCKPGFVRDRGGNCVLPSLCPVVCGVNEDFRECGSACPTNCTNRFQPIFCPAVCVKGCFCRDGFFRNSNGQCVRSDLCPAVCKENEIFRECGPACQHTCENLSKPLGPCTLQCVKGCFCKPGYVRNTGGRCILPPLCPVVCGENEVFKECGTACPTTCAKPNPPVGCAKICVKGCFCRDGFVRDPKGKCVRPQICPVVCKENEVFQECGSACPHTCNEVGKPTAPCTLPCIRGCFCQPGYVRNIQGNCILPNFCPVVCGENEEFKECGSACPANCTHLRPQCPAVCVKGCFCREGFVRDPQGKCVRPGLCPVVCKENEQFNECGSSCPLTCDNIGSPRAICTLQCVRGCFCKPGYVRDRTGRCILPNFCPIVCGVNEEFQECGTACPVNCTNRLQPQRHCPTICVKGCFCQSGFVRDSTGKCVPPSHCPIVCRQTEEFKECGLPCQITCDNLGIPVPPCPLQCIKGCFCKPGFVRNRDGNCVRPSLCPVVCGENEEFKKCGTACPATCTDPTEQRSCIAICVKGCFCKQGFVRDSSGKCVRPDLCPVVCRENEFFQECGPACPANCTNPIPMRSCPEVCKRGCFCIAGFIRDSTGRCVRPEQCPVVCGEKEVYQECGTACPPNCTHPRQGPCPLNCVKGCFCRLGFVRDPSGKCVLPQQCPVDCGEKEVYRECGTACPPNCTHPRQSPCPLKCVKGCFCRLGFVRNPSGKCVLPQQCPVVCGENEEFNACGTSCPASCANPKPQRSCLPCKRGCFCRQGFVRNPDGKCVRPEQCPPVCGENEEFNACGTSCPASCENPKPQRPCLPCKRGCFCRPGFVRHPIGKCVRPEQCPIVCKPVEVFKECGPACPANCTHPNPPRSGPNTTAEACVRGCFCKDGLIRSPDGECISPELCPICPKLNEEFLACGPLCIETCSRIDPRRRCGINCMRGCFCKKGLVRDIDGNCIRPSDCPIEPQECPPEERFYACKPTCGSTCDTLDPEIVRRCDQVCKPGCFCFAGFVKTRQGICVRPSQCPRRLVGRRYDRYDDEMTSVNTPEVTTAEILTTEEAELSTNPTTLDNSTPETTPPTTRPTETTTATTTEITSVSTVQSTTPTTTPEITSLPTTRTEKTRPIYTRRYGSPKIPSTTETSSSTDETQTVSSSTLSTVVPTTTEMPLPVNTPPAY